MIKTEINNKNLIKERKNIESNQKFLELEMETSKSRSPQRMEMKPFDHFLKLRNQSVFHTIEELMLKNYNNKPFFYFEPVFISFNDFSLLEAEVCLLCGGFSYESELLICSLCQESYHPYCLFSKNYNKSRFLIIKQEKLLWICPNCKFCEKCNKPPENINNLFCYSCEAFYHLNCAYKGIGIMPGQTWKCENCFELSFLIIQINFFHIIYIFLLRCSICRTKNFFSEKVDLTTILYEFCEDFMLCYECGILEAFRSFCRFCKKVLKFF